MIKKSILFILLTLSSLPLSGCFTSSTSHQITRIYPRINSNAKVIVIGAGISGIETARFLYDHNIQNLTLLEARKRIGGRIDTQRKGVSTPIDLGAAWIHGAAKERNQKDQNPLINLGKIYGLKTKIFNLNDSHSVYTRKTRNANGLFKKLDEEQLDRIASNYEAAGQFIDTNLPDNIKTIGQALRYYINTKNIPTNEQSNILFLSNLFIEFQYANDIDHLPLDYDDSYSFPGKDKLVLNGYDTLINGLAKPFRNKIKLNTPVTQINYQDPNNIIVTTQSGAKYKAQYVICTVPIGVLQHNDIQFIPQLPKDKRKAIHTDLQMNALDKVVMIFPKKFWDNTQFIGSIPNAYLNPTTNQWENKEYWPAYVNLHYYLNKPILIAFTSGDFALAMEKKNNKTITQNIMSILRNTYGKYIPNPRQVIVTRWKNDPYSRGSYTSLTTKALANNGDFKILQRPEAQGHLVFAGEGTSDKYSTTVHGAYLSGQRAGEQIYHAISTTPDSRGIAN
jgi:monoamine oxidase